MPRIIKALALLAFFTTGCIVNTGANHGIIQVQWEPVGGSCSALGIDSVTIRVEPADGSFPSIANVSCTQGSRSISVPEGDYDVRVEGLSAQDTVVAVTPWQTVTALAGFTQPTGVLPLGPTVVTSGSIGVAWTIAGDSAIAGCAKRGIHTVVVSVLDETKTVIVASAESQCSAGQLTVNNVPIGVRYLQIDGLTQNNTVEWGNVSLYGPIDVPADTLVLVEKPIDLAPLTRALTGSISLGWTVLGTAANTGCAKYGVQTIAISVLDGSGKQVISTGSVPCANGSAIISNVPSGSRMLQLDGLNAQGQLVVGNDPLTGPFQVTGGTQTVISPAVNLVQLSGAGGLTLTWTVLGKAPATECAKYELTNVDVRVLDDQKTQVLASVQVPCKNGTATLSNIPAGARYIQLDGLGPQTADSYGNVLLAGPVQIMANNDAKLANAIDIGKRTVVSLDWAFADGGSCASHQIGSVLVEVRDAGDKVVVPMNDPFAVKPCSISASSTYAQRVVDMGFVQPMCAIPPGAKGLVICNIPGSTIGVTLSGANQPSGAIQFGGSMQVKQIPVGTHIPVATALLLAPCTAGNPCTAP
jgi:hypothetical protein